MTEARTPAVEVARIRMTAASLTNTHFVGNDRWLFGPGRDLFLGCGVGYAVVLVAFLVGGNELKAWAPMGLLAFVLLFTSVPHYGATLMRVYNERESRRRYAVFSVWISLVLLVAFAVACHWYELGSGLFTVYLNWSPWHYAGQNYGIALMFLHRRGVEVTPTAKKWLYSSFVLAFLLAFPSHAWLAIFLRCAFLFLAAFPSCLCCFGRR